MKTDFVFYKPLYHSFFNSNPSFYLKTKSDSPHQSSLQLFFQSPQLILDFDQTQFIMILLLFRQIYRPGSGVFKNLESISKTRATRLVRKEFEAHFVQCQDGVTKVQSIGCIRPIWTDVREEVDGCWRSCSHVLFNEA